MNVEAISEIWRKISQDVKVTSVVLGSIMAVGFLVIVARFQLSAATSTALLWALACLVCGGIIGFVFGVPKTIQPATANDSPDRDAAERYRQQVNTNLTDISNWLTSIIVGLTLVNFYEIREHFRGSAQTLASGLGGDSSNELPVAFAIISLFSVLGFLFGYLYTRLFLAGAFSRADRAAINPTISRLIDESAPKGESAVLGPQAPTIKQLAAAQRIAEVASTDDSGVKFRMVEFAREYERTRAAMSPGDERTQKMEVIFTKMRALGIACYPMLREFTDSEEPGDRLAAVAILQVKPDSGYLDWLADRIVNERPFVGYHASVALQIAARTLGEQFADRIKPAIERAMSAVDESTDRYRKLADALQEL